MNQDARPEAAVAPVRPPDFLLPTGAQGTQRIRTGETEIFLSWGGAIYGPAGAEEVLAGVRTAWFEPDTLFWFEGQAVWLPVEEFTRLVDGGHHTLAARRVGAAPDEAPPLPSAARATVPRQSRGHRHRGRKNKPPRRHGRPSTLRRLIIFAFVLAAVAVTVVVILLLMRL